MESFSRLIVIAHIKIINHELCILHRMFSLQPQIRSLSVKNSLVKPMDKNLYRNEPIIKLSELCLYGLVFHSTTVKTNLFLSTF